MLELEPSAADAFAIPFSVVWTGFAVFWMTMALRAGAQLPFAMFGQPFVGVGFYLLVGRFFLDRRRRARAFYGLTKERALVTRPPRRGGRGVAMRITGRVGSRTAAHAGQNSTS